MSLVMVRDEVETVSRLTQLFNIARQAKSERYETWRRNYNLVHNKVGNRGLDNWRPSPRDSEIYPILSSIVGFISDQNTTVEVTAAANPGTGYAEFTQQIAQDLGTVIETNWQVESYAAQIKMAIWDGLMYGSGFLKAVWDQSLAGGLGNAKTVRVDPWSLYIDPNATSLEDAEYIIEARMMSLDEIERRFPGSSTTLEGKSSGISEIDTKPNSMGGGQTPKAPFLGNLQGAQTRWSGRTSSPKVGSSPLPSIVVYECWIKENQEWYEKEDSDKSLEPPPEMSEKRVAERWRVIVMAAQEILLDEYADDLWSYGTHPYDRFPFDDIGELYGIAMVDHLAFPQIYINRLLTAIQQNAELIGNPVFLEPTNAGLSRTAIPNKPGTRLTVTGAGGLNTARPEWMRPPEMPNYIRELISFWIERIENISGLAAIAKNGGDRVSENTLNSIQEVAFVRIRSAISNLEMALANQGRKLADLIIDNYTEPRYVAINGPDGQRTSLALRARHFNIPTEKGAVPLKYTLNITAGSQLPTSRQARAFQADKAYALGIIDRQAWMEANQYPNWPPILERIQQEMQAGSWEPPGQRQRSREENPTT